MTMVVNQVNDVDSGIDYWMSTHTELKSERETVERGKYTMGTEREKQGKRNEQTEGKKRNERKWKFLPLFSPSYLIIIIHSVDCIKSIESDWESDVSGMTMMMLVMLSEDNNERRKRKSLLWERERERENGKREKD